MDWKRMAVAGLKREREQLLARMQPELDRIDKLIAGFGGGTDGAKPKTAQKANKARSEAAKKMWAERRAKKEAHARTEARTSPGGASLREAAAS